jgi:hypothetical protein
MGLYYAPLLNGEINLEHLLLDLSKLLIDEENNLKYRDLAGAEVRLKSVSKFGHQLICIGVSEYVVQVLLYHMKSLLGFMRNIYKLTPNQNCIMKKT